STSAAAFLDQPHVFGALVIVLDAFFQIFQVLASYGRQVGLPESQPQLRNGRIVAALSEVVVRHGKVGESGLLRLVGRAGEQMGKFRVVAIFMVAQARRKQTDYLSGLTVVKQSGSISQGNGLARIEQGVVAGEFGQSLLFLTGRNQGLSLRE